MIGTRGYRLIVVHDGDTSFDLLSPVAQQLATAAASNSTLSVYITSVIRDLANNSPSRLVVGGIDGQRVSWQDLDRRLAGATNQQRTNWTDGFIHELRVDEATFRFGGLVRNVAELLSEGSDENWVTPVFELASKGKFA
ncbi:MAG: hypothetical protein IPK82_11210 [Polyangiaceae bacterium]|nr:hypothetical protein [Polyangiaceae bacterium]